MFERDMRDAIYSIYGFVRVADEIVDTFHDYDKRYLLEKFEKDYDEAFAMGISTNPVLHSFQLTVKKYGIPDVHIRKFLQSMKYDLEKNTYSNNAELDEYILGSAEVVGLMCLKVFCNGDETLYNELEKSAMKLGAAFQKVNFLRDLNFDLKDLRRQYFPNLARENFNESIKHSLIKDIENDFEIALYGIRRLPKRSKLAVLIAYYYYRRLLLKIQRTPALQIINSRVRVSNGWKLAMLFKASLVYKLRLL
jgi:phytoene/squalene synthetase